jgi:PadR family transcriptional regulator, regulatory protein PadR
VVSESLRGFDQGKLFVVPGWRYKLIVALMRTMPRPVMHWASRATAGFRRLDAGHH